MQTTEANTNTNDTNNANTNTNADTNTNANADNANIITLGDCARLLVAARLPLLSSSTPPPPQQQLTFEALLEALRQRPLVAAAGRLFAAFVALAEARHDGAIIIIAPPTTTERHTRTLLTACMIAGHPLNVFEFPTEPLEAALSAATAPFLHTLGRLVVAVATSALWAEEGDDVEQEEGDDVVGHDEEEHEEEHKQLLLWQILLPFGLATELLLLPQRMAAFEAAHAAWTAADVPRLVRRISLALLGLAQAHATALLAAPADHHDDALIIVAQIDTSIDQLRTQLVRLDGGAEALAAIDAAVGDGVAAADLLILPDLNLPHLNNNNNDNNPNDDADNNINDADA